jgi:hypothetical protein
MQSGLTLTDWRKLTASCGLDRCTMRLPTLVQSAYTGSQLHISAPSSSLAGGIWAMTAQLLWSSLCTAREEKVIG